MNSIKKVATKTPKVLSYERSLLKKIQGSVVQPIEWNPHTNEAAYSFLLMKWKERAKERGLQEPVDLSYACKFCSLFAWVVFSGEIMGNEDHQFCVMNDGRVLDFTEASELTQSLDPDTAWTHDDAFWMSKDHRDSLASIVARVKSWIIEFMKRES